MAENITTILLDIKNKNVRNELKEVVAFLDGFDCDDNPRSNEQPENSESYDILILEIGDQTDKEFEFAGSLQTSGIVRDVFFTSSNSKSEILMEALKRGAKGYFPQPINKEDVKAGLLKIKKEKDSLNKSAVSPVKKGKILNVMGVKGGVGTTTVAVNLAVSLAGMADAPKVLLVDMNVPFGEVALHLNMKRDFDWQEALKNQSRLDNTFLMTALSKHSSGLFVLFSPIRLDNENTINSERMETFLKILQTEFDYVVIDSGHHFNNNSRVVIEIANKILVVATLYLSSIINLKNISEIFNGYGYDHHINDNIEIIINRYHKNSDISVSDLEKSLNKTFLCYIPNAYYIFTSAVNMGQPICAVDQKTRKVNEVSRVFETLAVSLAGTNKKKDKRSRFSIGSIFS